MLLLLAGAVVGLALAVGEPTGAGGVRPPGWTLPGLVDLSAVPESVLSRPAVAVLKVEGNGLRELWDNPYERGRHWERIGQVAFLTNGLVQHESAVGVRVHGGGSRQQGMKSLRLYFRTSLEASGVPGTAAGLDSRRVYRNLVLHGDRRAEDGGGTAWHYVNPIAYEFTAALGVPVVKTRPISVVLDNGRPRPYVLTELLDLDWFEARYGHRQFLVFETKDSSEHAAIMESGPLAALEQRFGARDNWTLERISEVVDVDNMSRWFMAVLFCGTRDAAQGKMVLDQSRPDARWFWVAWDMDHSFGRKDIFSPETWAVDHWTTMLERPAADGQYEDARVVLLRHLFATSDSFRESFADLFSHARDSVFSSAAVATVLERYEKEAAIHGVTDTRYQQLIRDFMQRRPAALRELLERRLGVAIP
ncbi:MAG: CotH kinase family protein [Gemmatimonadota bacterium]